MMRWPRQLGLTATLAVLALLLALLGVLQYRWIGEIGRAEAERRHAQLERSVRRFAGQLERELGEVALGLHLMPGAEDRRALLVARLAQWSHNERAGLVWRVSLLSVQPDGTVTLETCDGAAGACRPGTWTPALVRVRERLFEARRESEPRAGRIRPGQLVDPPLALVLPLIERDELSRAADRWPPYRINGLLLAELDVSYLTERLLPQLAEQQFGPMHESEFVVSVLRRADRSLLYSSAPGWKTPSRPELERPLPASHAPDPDQPHGLLRGWRGGPRRGDASAERAFVPSLADAPWLLVVHRRGGSLEQAVAAVRRRNLAVGLGVLALLGAAGIVLAASAQRARGLARQQIELVAGVTHELNTPLAAIRSASQNLAHGIVTDPVQVRRYGAMIDEEARRLASLVSQVLDFAGIVTNSRPYVFEPVSLEGVVRDVLAELRMVLEQRGLVVTREIPAELPAVRGDAAALRRVVANLLTNAVKFAAAGGRVAIRASPAEDGRVVLRVEDAGPGIPHAERGRVFEPFYRGAAAQRNELPGAGLGLALVRRIVAAHGGRTSIEDAELGGTAVVVELPACPLPETA